MLKSTETNTMNTFSFSVSLSELRFSVMICFQLFCCLFEKTVFFAVKNTINALVLNNLAIGYVMEVFVSILISGCYRWLRSSFIIRWKHSWPVVFLEQLVGLWLLQFTTLQLYSSLSSTSCCTPQSRSVGHWVVRIVQL